MKNITQINPEVFLQKGETIAPVLDVSLRASEPSKVIWKEMFTEKVW